MKYFVEVKEIDTTYVEVEADSVEEAEKIAIGLVISGDESISRDGMSVECVVREREA